MSADRRKYPKDHPYHWPVIGHMGDLSAASAEDVRNFFRTYYAPQNASLVVAGDIDPADARRKIEHWFSDVERGTTAAPLIAAPPVRLEGVVKEALTDQVQLPRLYLTWHSPALYAPGDAELDVVASILSGGKNSRLYKRLVYDMEVAQSVNAFQSSNMLGSLFYIVVTTRPSTEPPAQVLERLKGIVDEELEALRQAPPTDRELDRVLNQTEAAFYGRMERVGGFGGKADQLNGYLVQVGNPDYFNEDLARYRALGVNDVQAAVRRWLPADRRLELTVVPVAGGGKCSQSTARLAHRSARDRAGSRLSSWRRPASCSGPSRDPIGPRRRCPVRPPRCRCPRFRSTRSRTACRCGWSRCTRCRWSTSRSSSGPARRPTRSASSDWPASRPR
jgi:zinc protease